MNLLILITIGLLLIVLLCIAFANRNIWGAVGAGILSIFLGYIIFVGGTSVTKTDCSSVLNQSIQMGNITTNTYKTICLNDTIIPEATSSEKLVFNGVALLLLIISLGLIFGTGINQQ